MAAIDTAAVKRAWALDEAIADRYGVALRPSGASRLLAHCPLPGHDHDRTPSFVVYRDQQRYHCFGCGRGGDVIDLVRTMEHIDFRAAVERLTAGQPPTRRPVASPTWDVRSPRPPPAADPTLREALALAVDFYARRLTGDAAAQAYLGERGLSPATITSWRLGLAGGLADYLAWLRLPRRPFRHLGLIRADGRERLAGRITIPELVGGQPVWLTGRRLPGAAETPPEAPRYESLPGPRPVLGLGRLAPTTTRTVLATEGVFDLLLLAEWGYPAVALGGASPARCLVQALTRFDRVVLLLDSDAAGQRGTAELVAALGARAVSIRLPADVKDVAELATVADGRQRLAAMLRPVLGGHDLMAVDLLNRDGRIHDDHD